MMMKKVMMMTVAGLLCAAAVHAQSVVVKPMKATVKSQAAAKQKETQNDGQQTTVMPKATDNAGESVKVSTYRGPQEEPLVRTVKKVTTTRTVQVAPKVKPEERFQTDTVKLESSPAKKNGVHLQMTPPERTTGKVVKTRTVRTIETKPASTETKNQKADKE